MNEKFSQMTKRLFSERNLQKKAVESGFYKRSGGIKPIEFFDMLLLCASKWSHQSLRQANIFLSEQFGVFKSKAGLNMRFNETSVTFVKSVFTEVLSSQIEHPCFSDKFLSDFKQLRIKDSTKIVLPECLQSYFKGCGGDSGKSSVSIQYKYDFKTGKILDVDLTDGIRNDHVDAKSKVENINDGDFVLRDLGYLSSDVLLQMIKQQAFFVSRLNANIAVFYCKGERFSFTKTYESMKSNGLTNLDIEVFIGKGKLVPIRMVLSIVPETVYEKRIRKIESKSSRKGYKTSMETKIRNRFTIFITNIDSTKASLNDIVLLYRLRWQVELCFKHWKSIYKIDDIPKMKKERFLCLLYAKLIVIVLNQQLIFGLRNLLYKHENRLLSIEKCVKTIKEKFLSMYSAFRAKKEKDCIKIIHKITAIFKENHWLDTKLKKVGTENIIFILL